MELTSQELAALYSQIENKSDKEIQRLINNDAKTIQGVVDSLTEDKKGLVLGNLLEGGIGFTFSLNRKSKASGTLLEICKKFAKDSSAEIKAILKNNPKKTAYILNIIQLLFPAIAQQYSGIPAMAVVGSITLLCRQGIDNFIK